MFVFLYFEGSGGRGRVGGGPGQGGRFCVAIMFDSLLMIAICAVVWCGVVEWFELIVGRRKVGTGVESDLVLCGC